MAKEDYCLEGADCCGMTNADVKKGYQSQEFSGDQKTIEDASTLFGFVGQPKEVGFVGRPRWKGDVDR